MRASSPTLLITNNDRRRLRRMLDKGCSETGIPRVDLRRLQCSLERAASVADNVMLRDAVTMNSTVELIEIDSAETEVYTLAYPNDADIKRGRISVLAPLGQAMLGRRAGDVVTVAVPFGAGERWYKIKEVRFQPERSN